MENQDTTTSMLLQYFMNDTTVADNKLVRNQIVTSKDNRRAQVTKEYPKAYSMITKSLENKFVTAKTLFPIIGMEETMATQNT